VEEQMEKIVDYYMTPSSPWTYLGHARFGEIAQRHGAVVRVKPVDYGVIFPQSGGLPLAKRAPQRQAYRLVELKRWGTQLGVPITIQPKHFPVNATAASCLVLGAPEAQRFALAGALLAALWTEEADIADADTLARIAARHGVDDAPAAITAGAPLFSAMTDEALKRGVFGAPTYVVRDELFWGQDRLEFVDRALARG
jgi:2-hydroxychromene-2-carboxylate isomerase